jgi:hypothetical protein
VHPLDVVDINSLLGMYFEKLSLCALFFHSLHCILRRKKFAYNKIQPINFSSMHYAISFAFKNL